MTVSSIRSLLSLLPGVVPVLVLAACVQAPVPQDRYYRIDVPPPDAGDVVLSGTLRMEPFITQGLTAGRAIIHVDAGDATIMQEYNYDFWAEPPATMVRDELMTYLRAAGVATYISTPEMRAVADYVFSGRIDRLEIIRGSKPGAYVELEMAITKTAGGRVRLVRSYGVSVDAGDGSVKAGVGAINNGINGIFSQFLADLRDG